MAVWLFWVALGWRLRGDLFDCCLLFFVFLAVVRWFFWLLLAVFCFFGGRALIFFDFCLLFFVFLAVVRWFFWLSLAGFYFFGVSEVIFLVFACGLLCCLLVVVFGVCGLVFCRGARVAVARPTRIPRTHRTTHTHTQQTHTHKIKMLRAVAGWFAWFGGRLVSLAGAYFFLGFLFGFCCVFGGFDVTHTQRTHTHTQNKNVTGDRPTK